MKWKMRMIKKRGNCIVMKIDVLFFEKNGKLNLWY